ncbi:virulence RhuM family protein [Parapedobacter sp. DT-150]|uniref:virulence RhuM family protein n=1 Tax=Parapedobacter sp. DT-150 TaxID=3396162 RepID=UPI003F1D727E
MHFDKPNSDFLLYQSEDGLLKIQVRLENSTVWLTQADMVALFQSSKSNISEHIKHVFGEGELLEESVVRKFRTTAADGKSYEVNHYNLDVIISVGYRVKSLRGTQFRIWATERLREYLIKGFAMNDDLLKQGGGYFEELLERIRDIRSSEKLFYRKVLEIYATSIDYDPKAELTQKFFQTVQNKLHWAAHGHTAAEVIFQRANALQPFMGLKTFKGKHPTKQEISIAKNYLTEEELRILNRLVSAYLDIAEINALQQRSMAMKDWIEVLDGFIKMSRQEVLAHAGKISAELAQKKALAEYEAYRTKTGDELSEVEKQFIDSISEANKALTALNRKKKK